MRLPLQIVFHGLDPSPALEAGIREHATRLDHFHPHVMGGRVVVEAPHRHHRQGRRFVIRIELTVPEGVLVAGRTGGADPAHEDPAVALRDAFDDIRRELEDHARRTRLDVKTHAAPPPASPEEGPPAA